MRRVQLMDLVLSLALVNVFMAAVVVGECAALRPDRLTARWWDFYVHFTTPAALGLAAALLAYHDRSPTRYAVALVIVCGLLFNAPHVQVALDRLFAPTELPRIAVGWWARRTPEANGMRSLLVLVALIPAVVGWWQRRQDRLATADEGE